MKLTSDQRHWVSRRKQGLSPSQLKNLVAKQRGLCALLKVPMTFDVRDRTPVTGGQGCHPLSPAVDHIDPGNDQGGLQIVCYALNDLKGHLPVACFRALTRTKAWKKLMGEWRKQARKDRGDREAFKRLLRPNAQQAAAEGGLRSPLCGATLCGKSSLYAGQNETG